MDITSIFFAVIHVLIFLLNVAANISIIVLMVIATHLVVKFNADTNIISKTVQLWYSIAMTVLICWVVMIAGGATTAVVIKLWN